MRISTSQIYQRGVDVMLEQSRKLSDTEVQLASGQRVLTPSDDPAATVKILDVNQTLDKLEQYQRNADNVLSKLSEEETALSSMTNILQRVRELAVQGNTDTINATDRAAIAKEVEQHLDGFLQLANTRTAGGDYLFGGHKPDQQPFERDDTSTADPKPYIYKGDNGQRLVQVGDSREVADGDPGSIFNMTLQDDTESNVLNVIQNLATAFKDGEKAPDALADLDTAINTVLDTQASIGARVNAVENQKSANESLLVTLRTNKSELEDLDYAEAISRFNQQLAALQASQQSFAKVQNLSLFNYIR